MTEKSEEIADSNVAGYAAAGEHEDVETSFVVLRMRTLKSSLSTEYGRDVATGLIAPGTSLSMDSLLARVALGIGFLASVDSVKVVRDH